MGYADNTAVLTETEEQLTKMMNKATWVWK